MRLPLKHIVLAVVWHISFVATGAPDLSRPPKVWILEGIVQEGDEDARLVFYLDRPTLGTDASVAFELVGGSAEIGMDVIVESGIAKFEPFESRLEIPITVAADGRVEGYESFFVVLSPIEGGATVGVNRFEMFVADSDLAAPPPQTLTPVWTIPSKLDGIAGRFGTVGDIDGDDIVIGAPGQPGTQHEAVGSAFHFDVETRQLIQELTWEEVIFLDFQRLGDKVFVKDGEVLVSAWMADNGTTSGRMALFDLNTGELITRQSASFVSSLVQQFGFSGDWDSDRLIIGAPNGSEAPGVAYGYERNGRYVRPYVPPFGEPTRRFGESVQIVGNSFAIASPLDSRKYSPDHDAPANGTGAVWIVFNESPGSGCLVYVPGTSGFGTAIESGGRDSLFVTSGGTTPAGLFRLSMADFKIREIAIPAGIRGFSASQAHPGIDVSNGIGVLGAKSSFEHDIVQVIDLVTGLPIFDLFVDGRSLGRSMSIWNNRVLLGSLDGDYHYFELPIPEVEISFGEHPILDSNIEFAEIPVLLDEPLPRSVSFAYSAIETGIEPQRRLAEGRFILAAGSHDGTIRFPLPADLAPGAQVTVTMWDPIGGTLLGGGDQISLDLVAIDGVRVLRESMKPQVSVHDGAVAVRWNTLERASYAVEWSPDLSRWFTLREGIIGFEGSAQFSEPRFGTAGYYRIRGER